MSLLRVVALVLSLAASAQADGCAPAPLAIPIGNVTMASNHAGRGLKVSVGTPPQRFLFMPQWPMNNSFMYGMDGHCPSNYTTSACTTFRGGSYDAFASITRKVPDAATYPVDSAPWSSFSVVSDTLRLNNDTSLDTFPLGVPLNDLGQKGFHPMNGLGLGRNSTLLNTLQSTGHIASRTWSMFWGRNGNSNSSQMEGLFVLGGYDKAKIQNKKYTQALSAPSDSCPTGMVLTLTDMVLNFSNGTDASMFPKASSSLKVCIVPDFPALMTIPDDPYFKAFETLTKQSIEYRSLGVLFYANRYGPRATLYFGDLTLKFQSGLSIRIPNDQLTVPNRYIDFNGSLRVNLTGYDTNFVSTGKDVDMSVLGRTFLSSAYVMLNQDANQFTLWQANPTTDRDLVAVDTANAEVTNVCTSAPPITTTPTNESRSNGVSGGTIAGITVGCLAAVGLIAGAAFLFCLRKRPRPYIAEVDATTANPPTPPLPYPTPSTVGSPHTGMTNVYQDVSGTKVQTPMAEMPSLPLPSRADSVQYQPVPSAPQHYELQG